MQMYAPKLPVYLSTMEARRIGRETHHIASNGNVSIPQIFRSLCVIQKAVSGRPSRRSTLW